MRRFALLIALVCSCAPSLLFAQSAPIDLNLALERGLIDARIEAAGGHTGQSVILRLVRRSKRSIRLRVPAGQLFEPADTSMQTLVNVKEEVFALENEKAFLRLYALCAEAHDRSPALTHSFTPGNLAAGALLELSNYISQNRLYREADAQQAVWCITDSMPVATLSHKGLLNITCQLLSLPLPDYQIETRRQAAAPGQPAYNYEPLSVRGAFEYQSNVEKTVSAYVVDSTGTKVREIFAERTHPPGWARYSFYFKTSKLPRGSYEVHLFDGEKVVQRIRVRY